MPCDKADHDHDWHTQVARTGQLVIERCEQSCSFCTGDAASKKHRFGWYLRRHVTDVHCKSGKDHAGLIVDREWLAPGVETNGEGKADRATMIPMDKVKAQSKTSDTQRDVLKASYPSPWHVPDHNKQVTNSSHALAPPGQQPSDQSVSKSKSNASPEDQGDTNDATGKVVYGPADRKGGAKKGNPPPAKPSERNPCEPCDSDSEEEDDESDNSIDGDFGAERVYHGEFDA